MDAENSCLALKGAYQKAAEDLHAANAAVATATYAAATGAAADDADVAAAVAVADAAYDKARAALEAYQAQQLAALE